MRLTPNLLDRFINAERRFERIEERFAAFQKQLDFFGESRCPLRGIKVEKSADGLACKLAFPTVSVAFRLLLSLTATGIATGKVVCTLEEPRFATDTPVLGSFTFNVQGVTDLEVHEDADVIDIEQHAIELALHFINAALERDEP